MINMKHDILADMFNIVKLVEMRGGSECTVPASKVIDGILSVMKKNGYIANYKAVKKFNSNSFKVELIGKINDCGTIKPRFSTTVDEITEYEKRFLPANDIGILFVTTSKGIMDHKEAKEINRGGMLLGYVW